jgi:hypothetical protein
MALLLAACSGGVDPNLEEDSAPRAFGLMSISYEHQWENSDDQILFDAGAQFIRYTALTRQQVGQLLALPVDPETDLPALDACQLYDLGSVDSPQGTEVDSGNIELLEAGTVLVEAGRETISLAPQHFAGLLPFVSGVIYAEARGNSTEPATSVRAAAAGSESVGSFAVEQIGSPSLARLGRVAGHGPQKSIPLQLGRDLTLQWRPSQAEGDLTYIELHLQGGDPDQVLRCRPNDDGAFTVNAKQITALGPKAGQTLVLDLARLRRAFFSANGLDQGELRVTVTERAAIDLH